VKTGKLNCSELSKNFDFRKIQKSVSLGIQDVAKSKSAQDVAKSKSAK
jgi:hypothetical protein